MANNKNTKKEQEQSASDLERLELLQRANEKVGQQLLLSY